MNERKKSLFLIIPFLVIIFGVSVINSFAKDKEKSESENRALTQRPTFENIKDKTFTSLYENYYTDQFVFREELMKLDTKWQLITKKSTVKGLYVTDDGWILGGVERNKKRLDDCKSNVDIIEKISNSVKKSDKKMYYVSLPQKEKTISHKYPDKYVDKNYGMENSKVFLNALKEKGITSIDVGSYFLDKFDNDELEEFYFKTDHHWNSKGAFEAFKYIIDRLNIYENLNIDLSKYNYKTSYIDEKPFIGSYNRNLNCVLDKNEKIPYVYMDRDYNNEYYELKNGKFERVKENYIIFDRYKEEEMTYGGAYTGNHSYYKMINKDAVTKKKIMVIRDSYQAPLTWLLSDLFYQVEIVDPRYVEMKTDEILEKSDSDIVLLMLHNGADIKSMLSNMES